MGSGDSGAGVFDQATFASRPAALGVAVAASYGADGTTNHGFAVRLDIHADLFVSGLSAAAQAMSLDPHAFDGQMQ